MGDNGRRYKRVALLYGDPNLRSSERVWFECDGVDARGRRENSYPKCQVCENAKERQGRNEKTGTIQNRDDTNGKRRTCTAGGSRYGREQSEGERVRNRFQCTKTITIFLLVAFLWGPFLPNRVHVTRTGVGSHESRSPRFWDFVGPRCSNEATGNRSWEGEKVPTVDQTGGARHRGLRWQSIIDQAQSQW